MSLKYVDADLVLGEMLVYPSSLNSLGSDLEAISGWRVQVS
jgi:hypothetical protein